MAVALIKEITGREGSKDVDTNRKDKRTFLVRTTTPQDGTKVVLEAMALAGYTFNAVYKYTDDSNPLAPVEVIDNQLVIVDVSVSQDNPNDPRDWRAVVMYAGVDDPVLQPADVEYSPTPYQQTLTKDTADKPILNSAGDPFESGITVDRTRFTLVITKAAPAWDPVAALAYQDTLNMAAFLSTVHPPGFAPGTCKIKLGGKRLRRAGTATFYWLVTATIDIKTDGWKQKVRDAGYYEVVRDPNPPNAITDRRPIFVKPGVLATAPQLLKDGKWVKPPDPVPDPLEFDGYKTKDWAPLNLIY